MRSLNRRSLWYNHFFVSRAFRPSPDPILAAGRLCRNEHRQGTGDFPRSVCFGCGSVQQFRFDLRLGRGSRLCGCANPHLGCPSVRSQARGREQGLLVAVHPAYDIAFDGFAAPGVRGNAKARQAWAEEQLRWAAKASANLGLKAHATFSGALAWPYMYPWPQRPQGLVETAFDELAKRWRPLLDAFDSAGVDLCYEIHPGEDLHDGETFEMFLDRVGNHPRCNILYDPSHFVLQQLDYLAYIDHYHSRIKMFHVKDAEFRPTGKQGVYGGFQPWIRRAGRFRSLGDGQVDFKAIFSKLTQYGYSGWAVLEWECCIKSAEQGAREGAPFIAGHIIEAAKTTFDDFASSGADQQANRRMLGLP